MPTPPAPWRLLDTPPARGAWNMALDQALAASVREGGAPVLRFYRWTPACLSLGRNQPARGRYDLDALHRAGVEVVRRPTGGRAVLHDRELTYSVAVAEGALGSPREAYAAINRALVGGLRRLGVPAQLQPETGVRAPVPSLAPCFKDPTEGEVVVAGRKLVGSAQRREDGVILQHGSLLLDGDQSEVRAFLLDPSSEEAGAGDGEPPTSLAALLPSPPSWQALTAALADGWRDAVGVALAPDEATEDEMRAAEREMERFAGAAWTWHH
ncbi:MAG TPA: lipoate--protein ligase family protein [Longimicrobiaceae bacterium]|jgi:lipoate-protein ligase A|nr:lipoate--protein ligase family protein [Longimicrobiaceae bacterium]